MPYVIDNSNGQQIVIPDGGVNQDFSIELVGRNYENYGEKIAKTQIDLLDNFSSSNAPLRPTDGQLWFDRSEFRMRVFRSATNSWQPISPLISETTVPANTNAQNIEGTMYYNKNIGQLFIHDGNNYLRTNMPGEVSDDYSSETDVSSLYGSKLRTIFLKDTTSPTALTKAVLALVEVNGTTHTPDSETIIAIFSNHPEFTVADTLSTTQGFQWNYYTELNNATSIGTTIVPGANYRRDNKTRVEVANVSDRANTSYALNLGSYGSDQANISASQVFYDSANSVPATSNTYDLGSSSSNFADIHGTNFFVGDGTTGSIQIKAGSTVDAGSVAEPFNAGYFDNLTINTSLNLGGTFEIGSTSERVDNIYADNINTTTLTVDGYQLPTSAGTTGQVMYSDGSGAMFFEEPASDIFDVAAGNGLSSISDSAHAFGPGGAVSRKVITMDVGQGTGILVNANNIEVDINQFSTTDITEGNNLYFTRARVRGNVSATSSGFGNLSYNSGTGVFTHTGPSESEIRGTISASGSISYDSSTGGISFTERTDGQVRGLISASSPILYDNSTGVISLDNNVDADTLDGIDSSKFARRDIANTFAGVNDFSQRINVNAGLEFPNQTNEIVFNSNIGFAFRSGPSTISNKFTMSTTGVFSATGDVVASSDERLKTNISVISNPLDKVDQIDGVTYDRIDIEATQTGCLAQQVQKVLPEAVHEDDNGMLSLAYGNMVGLLVEAVKELRTEVNDLKKQLGKD